MRRKLSKKEWYKVGKHLRAIIIHINIIKSILLNTTSRGQAFALNVLSKPANSTIEWVLQHANKQGKNTNKLIKILDIKAEKWTKDQ